jgi:hypothetical protein
VTVQVVWWLDRPVVAGGPNPIDVTIVASGWTRLPPMNPTADG